MFYILCISFKCKNYITYMTHCECFFLIINFNNRAQGISIRTEYSRKKHEHTPPIHSHLHKYYILICEYKSTFSDQTMLSPVFIYLCNNFAIFLFLFFSLVCYSLISLLLERSPCSIVLLA